MIRNDTTSYKTSSNILIYLPVFLQDHDGDFIETSTGEHVGSQETISKPSHHRPGTTPIFF